MILYNNCKFNLEVPAISSYESIKNLLIKIKREEFNDIDLTFRIEKNIFVYFIVKQ